MLAPEFRLRPSRIYLIALMLVMSITAILILTLQLKFALRFFILLSVTLYMTHIVLRYALLRHSRSILALKKQGDVWLLDTPSGTFKAELLGNSVSTRFITILNFRFASYFAQSCVILPDSLVAGEYRKLIIALR